MKIGLIDVDGHHFPNLALMKLSAWHKRQGDSVEWWWGFGQYDRVYMSKVFDNTYSPDEPEPLNAAEIIKGGTGYGLSNKLPYDVEHMYPDYSLYPKLTGYGSTIKLQTAYGFLTRGCPRGCPFCIVAGKEGLRSIKVANLSEFWNGQGNIELLDPNLLACSERFSLLKQLEDSRAKVNFSQGLDIRMTTPEIAIALGRIRVKRLHFAWDNPNDDLRQHFKNFHEWYPRKSSSRKAVYVLVNYCSTMEENLYRIYTLQELGYDPYVMIYDKPNAPREIKRLQRWCNSKFIFRSCSFEAYERCQKDKIENLASPYGQIRMDAM